MTSTAFEGTLLFAAADSPTAGGDAVPLRLHGESAAFSVAGKTLEITSAIMEGGTTGEYHLYLATANTDETGLPAVLVRVLASMDGHDGSVTTPPGFRALALDPGDSLWFKMTGTTPTGFVKVCGIYHE